MLVNLQEVMHVVLVLVDFGERHDKRAALHCSRPPTDQSGKRAWQGEQGSRLTRATFL